MTRSSKLDPFHTSARPASVGMWLILASLAMLFIAGMLIYVLLRLQFYGHLAGGQIRLPAGLWFSTAVLLAGSFTIHRCIVAIRRERVQRFSFYLQITFVLALIFLAIQFPSLWEILRIHQQQPMNGNRLYGLIFCLILLHAAHVVGGIIAMTVVTINAIKGKYDHENYDGVRNAALYWHFLDIVWLIMFGTFLITGG